MQITQDALAQGFEHNPDAGTWTYRFGDGYELIFEQLLWEGQMYVALYKDEQLLTNKVVVKPGKL